VHEYAVGKADHVPGGYEYDEDGHYHVCATCGERIDSAEHEYGEENITKTPTCTEEGEAERVCSVCGYVHKYALEKTGHTPGEYQHDENGHYRVCTACGEVLDPAEHEYGEERVITAPTCTEDGEAEKVCAVCGHSHRYVLEKTGHVPGELCRDGSGHWHVCANCGEVLDKEDHEYDDEYDPTCGVCGYVRAVRGDVNGDGKINNKDIAALFAYISSDGEDADPDVYDFNVDGKINNKDIVAMFRYVSSQ
ncbi:MAG: dockerin type I repeat-containing protein, partial [Clostridia bacterium]|nr:dockerin type I repeat-containing protein [Clostridia bacterium]